MKDSMKEQMLLECDRMSVGSLMRAAMQEGPKTIAILLTGPSGTPVAAVFAVSDPRQIALIEQVIGPCVAAADPMETAPEDLHRHRADRSRHGLH